MNKGSQCLRTAAEPTGFFFQETFLLVWSKTKCTWHYTLIQVTTKLSFFSSELTGSHCQGSPRAPASCPAVPKVTWNKFPQPYG